LKHIKKDLKICAIYAKYLLVLYRQLVILIKIRRAYILNTIYDN